LGTITDRLSLTEFEFAGHSGIAVVGEVDEGSCRELELALKRVSNGGGLVHLDLHDCTFLDSKGLDVIVRAAMRLWDEGAQLTVYNARGPTRELFRINALAGVDGLMLRRDLPG
jgi:anti-anti-sigma factor